jgi:hypothetical protein
MIISGFLEMLTMFPVRDLARKFLNLDFAPRNERKHVANQGTSTPISKLIALGTLGVLWGVIVSSLAYWITINFM